MASNRETVDWRQTFPSGMLEVISEGQAAEAKERPQACLS